MTDDDRPIKSAYELAMERLKKKDAEAGIEHRPLTDEQKAAMGDDWTFIGYDTSEQLAVIPRQHYVITFKRAKYAPNHDAVAGAEQGPVAAAQPEQCWVTQPGPFAEALQARLQHQAGGQDASLAHQAGDPRRANQVEQAAEQRGDDQQGEADAAQQEEHQPEVLRVEDGAKQVEPAIHDIHEHRRVASDLDERQQDVDRDQDREDDVP